MKDRDSKPKPAPRRRGTSPSEGPAPRGRGSEDSRASFNQLTSLDLHRSVLASMTEGVVVQMSDGAIVDCNAAAERILGLSFDQMCGRTSTDPRWRALDENGEPFEGHNHPAMTTLRTGEPQRNVLMGIHKPSGELTWISINSQPLRSADGQHKGVVSTFTDVSDTRESALALRRSEERLRLALTASRMGSWEWDIETGAVHWSDEVTRLFGLSELGFAGTFDAYFERVHPADRDYLQRSIDRAVQDPDVRYEVEHRIVHPDGATAWIRAYGQVLRDEHGKPTTMLGTVLDVTDQHNLQAQLLQAQKMESVGRLAGGIAHDFNNLMTAVIGSAQLAGLQAQQEPVTLRHLHVIEEAAERAAQLTRQLLAFARQQVLELRPIQPTSLVKGMELLLQRMTGEDVQLEIELSGDSHVRGDRAQLEQVLANLAINARDAMSAGGRLSLRVCDEWIPRDLPDPLLPLRAGPHVKIQVQDTGVGMGASELARACEPFFTTKKAGSGLGLATCYGIVSQLQGHMGIESEPGQGTTVTVLLPATDARPAPASEVPESASRGGRETILVAEDEQLVRQVLVETLRSAGYQVVEATNGRDALQWLGGDASFDLLVSDVVMPESGGVELAQRFRAQFPHSPVLLVSGHADEAIESRTAALKGAVLLSKPYTPRELVQRVRALLDARGTQRPRAPRAQQP